MATIATLVVDVIGNTTGLNSSLGKAQGSIAGFGKVASPALLGVGAAIAAVGVVSIKAASDLNESLNKSQVVFGEAAKSVEAFSQTTAESFGISQAAALDAAAGFGAMAQAAGVSESESAKMSISLVKLAADMASFNNQDPSEMLERLRSGLAGEAEPLRKFGVFISEARVQQEALTLGIAKAGEELTDAQKIQARYAIVLKDTTKQQGDFSRTISESLPNQLRVLKARLTDLAASIGKDLLPVAVQLLTTLQDIIDIVQKLGGPIGDTKNSVETLGGSLGKLGTENATEATKALVDFNGVVEQLPTNMEPGQTGVEQMTQRFRDMDGEMHTLLLTYAVFADGSTRLVSSVEEIKQATEEAGKATHKWAGLTAAATKQIAEDIKGELPGIIGTVTKWKDVFTLSPAELVKITHSWVQIGKTIARDLRELSDSDLSPAMKQAIAALPPEMRHAWAEGNQKQKKAIEDDLLAAWDLVRPINKLAEQAKGGFKEVGKSAITGAVLGVTTNSELLSNAVRQAVHDAIEAGKREAGANSPSKVMAELGHDLMQGLANGINDAEEKALKAAQKVIEDTIKAIEKRIDTVSGLLDKIRSKASSFAGTISAGIGGFGDIAGAFGSAEAGTPLAAIIATQLGGAQQFADVLEALKRQGASKALLSQAAGDVGFAQAVLSGGPAQIQEANQALNEIADLARQTGKGLSEAFFGQKVDKLEHKLDILHNDLQREQQFDRVVVNIQGWVGNDQELAKRFRDELIKLGHRNAGTGL